MLATTHSRFALRLHPAAMIAIAVLTLASFHLLDRGLHVRGDATAGIEQVDRQRVALEHVTSLAGQYALGSVTQAELLGSIDAFARSTNVAGVPNASASRQAATVVATARRVGTLAPHDPQIAATAGRLFAAARPLATSLAALLQKRELQTQANLGQLRDLGLWFALALLAALVVESVAVVRPLTRRVADFVRESAEWARLATTDPLTGALNRRGFQTRGAIEVDKAKRYNRPLSLLMIDPDNFSALNATHGERAGENVLKALTASLIDETRTADVIGRVGGEEIAILLPETDAAGAELVAERLRRRICELTVPVGNSVISCTVSIGIAVAEKSAAFFEQTLQRADEALYEAQMRGRNCVFVNTV